MSLERTVGILEGVVLARLAAKGHLRIHVQEPPEMALASVCPGCGLTVTMRGEELAHLRALGRACTCSGPRYLEMPRWWGA